MAGSKHSGLTSNITSAYAVLLMVTGIAVALGALTWEEAAPRVPHYLELARKLLDHLAVALFSIGLVAIIIEFRDWQEYFQKRIAETILQRAYLRTLGHDQLIALQTDTMKAFFAVDDLDRKDSFLEFSQKRLQAYIGSPFREDVDFQIAVSDPEDKSDYWQIDEVSSYRLRAVGGNIQDHAIWMTEPHPFAICGHVTFTVTRPHDRADGAEKSQEIFQSEDVPNAGALTQHTINQWSGYRLNLEQYRKVDGLAVKIHAQYQLLKGTPLPITLAHVTRRFALTLKYPEKCRAIVNFFGFYPDHGIPEENDFNPGLYTHRFDSWLLPSSGISVDLVTGTPASTRSPLKSSVASSG